MLALLSLGAYNEINILGPLFFCYGALFLRLPYNILKSLTQKSQKTLSVYMFFLVTYSIGGHHWSLLTMTNRQVVAALEVINDNIYGKGFLYSKDIAIIRTFPSVTLLLTRS